MGDTEKKMLTFSVLGGNQKPIPHKYVLLCTCLLLQHITLSLSGGEIQFLHWHKLGPEESLCPASLPPHIIFLLSPTLCHPFGPCNT